MTSSCPGGGGSPFLFSAVRDPVHRTRDQADACRRGAPSFAELSATSGVVRMPIADAFRKHWRQILLVAGAISRKESSRTSAWHTLFPTGHRCAKIGRTWALFGVFVAAAVAVVMYPLFGSLSDRCGPQSPLLDWRGPDGRDDRSGVRDDQLRESPCCSSALWCWCSASRWHPRPVSPVAVVFHGPFDADVRYQRRLDRIHPLSSGRLGRSPTIAAALYGATKTSDSIVAYLIAVSVVSAVSVSLLPGGWRRVDGGRVDSALKVS